MPEASNYTVRELTYGSSEYLFEPFHLGDLQSINFSVLCDKNYVLNVYWLVNIDDDVADAILTDTVSTINYNLYTSSVKAGYVKFEIVSIASNPCVLKTQLFALI